MKKLFVLLSCVPFYGVFAQEVPTTTPEKTVPATTTTTTTTTTISTETNKPTIFIMKDELKLGGVKMLLSTFELTYEHIQSKNFGYGSSISFNYGSDAKRLDEGFSITPFARFYFQETKEYGAKGFFVEGFAKYSSGRYDVNSSFWNIPVYKDYSAFGIGLAGGKKWINSSGFILETLF